MSVISNVICNLRVISQKVTCTSVDVRVNCMQKQVAFLFKQIHTVILLLKHSDHKVKYVTR